jgi:hypothetical protein
MKKSPERTKQQIAMALLVVAALLIVRGYLGTRSSGPGAPATAAPAAAREKASLKPESLDPRLHLDLLANSEEVRYEGRGKNIFTAAAEEIPPVVINPLTGKPLAPGQPLPPTPPPPRPKYTPPAINLKYIGSSNAKGEKPRAFLSQGDDVWSAREGEVVNRQYKIIRISPASIEVEDLLNNNRQSIRLTEG